MLIIRKATTADCELIHKLAWQIFPETYKDILSPEQNDYMMEWMYSIENIRKQMEEEGHVYFIGYKNKEVCGYVSVQQQGEDLFHLQKYMYSPPFKDHIAVASYFMKPSNTSRKYILVHA